MAGTLASATSFQKEANIVELLQQSELILHGTVTSVTDGIDEHGLPYTEVKLHVTEALRGQVGSEYTFRQFGLLKPRDMGNGRKNVMVTPAGWATYNKGEETILFLHKQAALTGLRTTAGLGQGKFKVAMGSATNHNTTLLKTNEQRAMLTGTGPVNVNAFKSLIRQAVKNQWVEKGSMRNAEN
jgi:hypothetical protein